MKRGASQRVPIPAAPGGPAELKALPGFGDIVPIGFGGTSTVYRARQVAFDRLVAVKVLAAADARVLRRFQRETKILGRLSGYPSIAQAFDAGLTPAGAPYLVMQYYPGGSLADLILSQGPQPVEKVLAIGVRLAATLAAAHGYGVLHRDLKPGNIMLDALREPVVVDFGIAGWSANSAGYTAALTYKYAAPEVVNNPTIASRASDQYSLALTLWAALEGGSPWADLAQRRLTPPPPTAPAEVLRVLERALAPEPTARFPSCEELARELQRVQERLGLPITTAPAVPEGPMTGPVSTNRNDHIDSTEGTSLRADRSDPASHPDGDKQEARSRAVGADTRSLDLPRETTDAGDSMAPDAPRTATLPPSAALDGIDGATAAEQQSSLDSTAGPRGPVQQATEPHLSPGDATSEARPQSPQQGAEPGMLLPVALEGDPDVPESAPSMYADGSATDDSQAKSELEASSAPGPAGDSGVRETGQPEETAQPHGRRVKRFVATSAAVAFVAFLVGCGVAVLDSGSGTADPSNRGASEAQSQPSEFPLAAPTSVSAERVDDDTVQVRWDDNNAGRLSYFVYRTGSGEAAVTTEPGARSLNIDGVPLGPETTCFRVGVMDQDEALTSEAVCTP